ncbi:MAG: 50S ribosomal protein L6 [candidate division Zixibacteria bacterium SM23_73_2]|nr:MAG: 50S ribosomal protein L6 [candidate division Zixibacteria bacterium SM23_73_2]
MSRVGKKPIPMPEEVKVEIKPNNQVVVTGPKGSLFRAIHPAIQVRMEDNQIVVERSSNSKFHRSLHGLSRMLIANMITGVISEFKKTLTLSGIGYKAESTGKLLNLSVGYSHPIVFSPPQGIQIKVENPTKIVVSGIDKELVGMVAAKIRSFRPPEPYRGKGIKYEDEVVRRKAGKTAT